MCWKVHRRKPSLFYNIGFITFDTKNNPQSRTTTPRCARGKNFFDMRYIFIRIHQGRHFICDAIYMEQKKIEYYNLLRFDNITRQGCRHKIKMQEDTLQVLRDYLQNKHMKEKHKDFPNDWNLNTIYKVPQQDKMNTTACGVFVCIYCDFILRLLFL